MHAELQKIGKILTDLVDEYIESHRETLDLLSKPEWVEIIGQGKKEVSKGIKGKGLHELEN